MPSHETESLILRSQDFGETDLLLTILTRRKGKLRGIVKSGRKSTSKLAGLCQLFNQINLVYYAKEQTELVKITRVDLITSREEIRQDIDRLAFTSLLSEILQRATGEMEPHEELFDWATYYFQGMTQSPHPQVFTLASWIKLLQCTGFVPLLSECVKCRKKRPGKLTLSQKEFYFDCKRGGILCTPCYKSYHSTKGLHCLPAEAVHFLVQILHLSSIDLETMELHPDLIPDLFQFLLDHTTYQLEGNFQSTSFLKFTHLFLMP